MLTETSSALSDPLDAAHPLEEAPVLQYALPAAIGWHCQQPRPCSLHAALTTPQPQSMQLVSRDLLTCSPSRIMWLAASLISARFMCRAGGDPCAQILDVDLAAALPDSPPAAQAAEAEGAHNSPRLKRARSEVGICCAVRGANIFSAHVRACPLRAGPRCFAAPAVTMAWLR